MDRKSDDTPDRTPTAGRPPEQGRRGERDTPANVHKEGGVRRQDDGDELVRSER